MVSKCELHLCELTLAMCLLCLCGLVVSHRLASKERSQVAYVRMPSSGDGHRCSRNARCKMSIRRLYALIACVPHHANVHVEMCLSEAFPHCNTGKQFENLHQVIVVMKRILI